MKIESMLSSSWHEEAKKLLIAIDLIVKDKKLKEITKDDLSLDGIVSLYKDAKKIT